VAVADKLAAVDPTDRLAGEREARAVGDVAAVGEHPDRDARRGLREVDIEIDRLRFDAQRGVGAPDREADDPLQLHDRQ
jgi:hypothetical protein